MTVADRGPGLSPEHAEQAGQRFWRGGHGRQRQDGSGLGLSIVRAIGERFDVAFTLQGRDGGGLVTKLVVATQTEVSIRGQ